MFLLLICSFLISSADSAFLGKQIFFNYLNYLNKSEQFTSNNKSLLIKLNGNFNITTPNYIYFFKKFSQYHLYNINYNLLNGITYPEIPLQSLTTKQQQASSFSVLDFGRPILQKARHNPFEYKVEPKPLPVKVAIKKTQVTKPAQILEVITQAPPQAPEIKYLGQMVMPNQKTIMFIEMNNQSFEVVEGMQLESFYKVLKVQARYIEVLDLLANKTVKLETPKLTRSALN